MTYTLVSAGAGQALIYQGNMPLRTHADTPWPPWPRALAESLKLDLNTHDPTAEDPRRSLCYCVSSTQLTAGRDRGDAAAFHALRAASLRQHIQVDRAFRLQPGPHGIAQRAAVACVMAFLDNSQVPGAVWRDLPLELQDESEEPSFRVTVSDANIRAFCELAETLSPIRSFSAELVCQRFHELYGQSSISLAYLWAAGRISTLAMIRSHWLLLDDSAAGATLEQVRTCVLRPHLAPHVEDFENLRAFVTQYVSLQLPQRETTRTTNRESSSRPTR